jgi:hypothetical protein
MLQQFLVTVTPLCLRSANSLFNSLAAFLRIRYRSALLYFRAKLCGFFKKLGFGLAEH